MKRIALIILLIAGICNAVTVRHIVRVKDGDTFSCNILDWPAIIGINIPIRLAGINCPELKDPNGIRARNFAEKALRSAKQIELENVKRGKYFRIVADVLCDGNNLSDDLIAAGLAVPYTKKPKTTKKSLPSVEKLKAEIALLKKENLELKFICGSVAIYSK